MTFARPAALALGVLLALTATVRSEEDRSGLIWLTGEQIRSEFSGASLAGLYPSLKAWTELIRNDGSTDYREGDKHWIGQWWVQNREFCFFYPPPGLGGCFRVTRISANCFELYQHESVPGRAETPPDLANQWNGRMWHADRPTTCEARPTA